MWPWRAWQGPLLIALAVAAVALLPLLGYAFTRPRAPNDFEAGLRAHVGWARVLAFGLVAAGALALARLFRRDPARAARQAVFVLVASTVVAGAALTPLHDEWVDARMRAKYLSAGDGWETKEDLWFGDGPESRAFVLVARYVNHTGPVEVPMPPLAKGDSYRAIIGFDAGARDGYYHTAWDVNPGYTRCLSWDGQMPTGRPGSDDPVDHRTMVIAECTATRAMTRVAMTAKWGEDRPVNTMVQVLLTPAFDRVVLARLDTSVAMVAGAAAVAAPAAIALAAWRHGVPEPARRRVAAALAVAPATVALAWALHAGIAAAGLAGGTPGRTSAATFTALAAAAGAAGVTLALLAARPEPLVAGPLAVRASAIAVGSVAIFSPVAAQHAWRFQTPWVLLGVMGTLVVSGLMLLGAHGLTRAPRQTSTAVGAPFDNG